MRMEHIIPLFLRYAFIGAAALTVLLILFFIGWLIYKKVFKGQKNLNKKYPLLGAVSFLYLFIVACAVFADRTESTEGIQYLFSSYRLAWYSWSGSDWLNIILNILLFVPFGFLLPLWHKKFNKAYIVIPAGFLLTLVIETLQYILKLGVFECDDILNNTVGAFLGFCALQIVICIAKRRRFRKTLLYFTPYLAVAAVFCVIFLVYELQPYGNLEFAYYEQQNMRNKTVTVDTLADFDTTANVYKPIALSKEEAHAKAAELFSAANAEMDGSTELYENGTYRMHSVDGNYEFTMDTEDGSYKFENTAYFQMESKIRPSTPFPAATVCKALKEYHIDLPQDCYCEVAEGDWYAFRVDRQTENGLLQGYLYCSVIDSGEIVSIENHIIRLDCVSSEDIISVWDALDRIKAGKFPGYYLPEVYELKIKNCQIEFSEDTKGFYQPMYCFNCEVVSGGESREESICIPALK